MAQSFKRRRITATIIERLEAGQIVMDTDEPSFGVRRQKAKAVFYKYSNPVRGLERFREKKWERFLSNEEIVRLGSALTDSVITAKHSPFALAAIARE
jgi:hypothetical protein